MRRFLKFLHTVGAIGFMGAIASFLVLSSVAPAPSELAGYALIRGAMGSIGTWIFLPSLTLTLAAGLLAIAFNPGFQNAGWAWAKLASGILIFEGGLVGIQGSIQDEAERAASALAGRGDVTALGLSLTGERNTLWVILAVSTANVVLGVWRPRFMRRRGGAALPKDESQTVSTP